MSDSKKGLRDLIIAGLLGFSIEVFFAVFTFMTSGRLTEDHPWLNIVQMPGGEISLRLFGRTGVLHHYSGVLQAQALAILIQSFIFATMILGMICVYRLIKSRART